MLSDRGMQRVRERACFRCEYCRAPENVAGYAFHMEHILPRCDGGKEVLANIALSCMNCNRAKWHHTMGVDPESLIEVRLFNPRKDRWSDHFTVEKRICLRGKTPIGRATVSRLALNHPRQLEARAFWSQLGIFP